MKNLIHSAWTDANPEERFAFLVMLDLFYGEGKGQRGRGLQLIHQSYIAKIKRVEEGTEQRGIVRNG